MTQRLNPTSTTPFVEWTIGPRTISLFDETDRFAFSSEGLSGPRFTFKPPLYEMQYAKNLILLFRNTIGINLEKKETIDPSYFLPKICLETKQNPHVQVALFGRVDTSQNEAGSLEDLRYGVIDTKTNKESTFEAIDSVARAFILHARSTNRAVLEPVVDKKGKPILDKQKKPVMKEGPGSYPMTEYAKRFCASVEYNDDQQIQSVALHHLSVIDQKTYLSEEDWAVTLVSTQNCCRGSFARLFTSDIGHAMLACEGVQEGKQFLKYIHLTQEPEKRLPTLESDEAQIESFESPAPLSTVNTPTWIRSKALVEQLFSYADSLKNIPVKFAFSGDTFYWRSRFSRFLQEHYLNTTGDVEGYVEMKAFDDRKKVPSTCLDWARELADHCGIFLGNKNGQGTRRAPIQEIQRINSNPILIAPNTFSPTSLGKPFADTKFRTEMLFAGTVLSPSNCLPEDASKWRKQWDIEKASSWWICFSMIYSY